VFSTTGTLTFSGSIDVSGGNGGNGGNGGANLTYGYPGGAGGGGGAGGAGGTIVFQATSISMSGTLQAQGGEGGAGGMPGQSGLFEGYNGAGGGGGRILIVSPNPVVGAPVDNHSNASQSTGGNPVVTVLRTSACTPTISAIQVNGQVTNAVIAGSSGYITIYGSCLGGPISATAAKVGGGDITQITGILNVSDQQVNVLYSTVTYASGPQNLTLQTINGTSNVTLFATQITLQSFTFGGSTPYSRDCALAPLVAPPVISNPTWPAPTTDPNNNPLTCLQVGYAGDHAVYAAGQTMAGTAVFSVSPPLPADLTSSGIPGVYFEGLAAGVGNFRAPNVTIPLNQPTFSVPVTFDTPFPTGQTQFYNPLQVAWVVNQSGGSCDLSLTCVYLDTSSNPVYVTLGPNPANQNLPSWAQPLMLTYVALAVGNGGANSPATAVANTWAKFSLAGLAPENVTTWEPQSPRPLAYYPSGVPFKGCATNAYALVTGNGSGQCGSFQFLLASALMVNGIQPTFVKVLTISREAFMVNTWSTNAPAGSPYPGYPWTLQTYGDPGPSPGSFGGVFFGGMVPNPNGLIFGDLTDGIGTPGQNSPTPSEKIFGPPSFISVPSNIAPSNQGPFLDPSYGLWYLNQADFEAKAVAYYAEPEATIPDAQGNPQYSLWGVRSKSGATNICFALAAAPPAYGTCN
jgi:hypothetical protein